VFILAYNHARSQTKFSGGEKQIFFGGHYIYLPKSLSIIFRVQRLGLGGATPVQLMENMVKF